MNSLVKMKMLGMVVEKIKARGWTLGRERKDPYIHDLAAFIKKGGSREEQLVDRLLLAAMIEARSCERFRMLSELIEDEDLRTFYHDLMVSEAQHYTSFIGFARQYGGRVDVDARWKAFLAHEAQVIQNYGRRETMHG